ncbi:hypothetical protein Tco_0016685 [Tanacetum coccineum]
MAALAIAISSDSSDESVGSPPSRVILFGDIPTVIPSTSVVALETSTIALVISSAAPVVETTLVASPTGLCGLVPYSGSDSNSPDEMSSLEHISLLPAISPFLCTDSSEAPDSSDGPPSLDPYVATVARWRSRGFLSDPLNGPRKLLTARKRVGPLPARRLASRRVSPHSSDHRSSSSSSSSDSSPVHSSGLDAPDQAHSGSSTRDVSPRLGYPLRRASRHSEAFRRWCATPLSSLYPPTTLESSSGDSSERPLHSYSHSVRPSRKRYISLVDSVPSSMPVMGSLAPTRADLLPPCKRFRDSYLSEAIIEEDTKIDPIETEVDMELGIGDGDDVRYHVEIDHMDVKDDTEGYEADTSVGDTIEVGIDPMSAPIVEEEIVELAREDSLDSSSTRDGIVRSFEDMPIDLDDAARDFYHHMSEVRIDRIIGIETIAIEELVNRCVEEALAAHKATRAANALETENKSQNGSDGDNGNGRNENPDENGRGDRHVARECTYQDFMKCQPLNFNGIEGVVRLIRWFENMETVFHISNCPEKSQVKYATCTLLDSALTWWNSHKRTIGTEAAFSMSWRELMKLMTEVYCPRNEIQKMETELGT